MKNVDAVRAGDITEAHLRELTCRYQTFRGLTVDGECGPATRAAIDADILARSPIVSVGAGKLLCWPLRALPDGRLPKITSGHAFSNPSRPKHWGCDILYPYNGVIDEPIYAAAHGGARIPIIDPEGGDAGAAAARGKVPKWWVPDGTEAIAVAPGEVVSAHDSGTGHLCWLDIGAGLIVGYFHLSSLLVRRGDVVSAGDAIGIVGDSTAPGHDPRHLHFEGYVGKATALGTAIVGYPHGLDGVTGDGTIDLEPSLKHIPVLPAR